MIPYEKKLLELLSNNDVTFFIPPYQRNYEWTDEQCKVFFDDMVKTCENNLRGKRDEHFFGSITYFQAEAIFGQPNKLVLIDGQQRITTTMLFLVALRDITSDEAIKAFIDAKYLKNNNVTGDIEYKVKLKQVETDWAAYKKIILNEALADKEKNSAVYRNYSYFIGKLKELTQNEEVFKEIVQKGLNQFSVITIQLEPDKNAWENPQEIFESMNSLGKPLSLADLVRNYIMLGLSPENQEKYYSKYWLKIEKIIPGKVSDFIRDYMQEHERKSFLQSSEKNYKELYSSFKTIFKNTNIEELLDDLSECAIVYSYITYGGGSENEKINRELRDLKTLGLSTAYSFLMSLLKEWKKGTFIDKDVVDILYAFKMYCLRRRLLGLASGENKALPRLSLEIESLARAQDKKLEMFKIVSKQENNLRLPNDVEMRNSLETMNFYNFKHCKFYMSLIEEQLTKCFPSQEDEKLQKEHIMPQTLNNEWRKSLGENHEEIHINYVNSIGNLTLIRHNQELGNKAFSDKKVIYENYAGLQIARTNITNRDKWGEEEIKARASWMIDYLLKNVLPIPDSMRKTNNFKIRAERHLSFNELQLIGERIHFVDDYSIVAKVVNDKEVEFEGKNYSLSALTREIYTRKGTVNNSGAYQGPKYWEYDGIRITDIL